MWGVTASSDVLTVFFLKSFWSHSEHFVILSTLRRSRGRAEMDNRFFSSVRCVWPFQGHFFGERETWKPKCCEQEEDPLIGMTTMSAGVISPLGQRCQPTAKHTWTEKKVAQPAFHNLYLNQTEKEMEIYSQMETVWDSWLHIKRGSVTNKEHCQIHAKQQICSISSWPGTFCFWFKKYPFQRLHNLENGFNWRGAAFEVRKNCAIWGPWTICPSSSQNPTQG